MGNKIRNVYNKMYCEEERQTHRILFLSHSGIHNGLSRLKMQPLIAFVQQWR